jgi:hypothetical protein
MNCPHCGAWTTVLETRGTDRKRECANAHRFWSREAFLRDMLPPYSPVWPAPGTTKRTKPELQP